MGATASTTTVWDKVPKNTAPPTATNAADEKWQAKLDSNVAGTQQNAQDFTKEFMGQMYGSSTQQTEEQIQTALELQSVHSSVDEHYEEMMQYAEPHQQQQLLSQEVV